MYHGLLFKDMVTGKSHLKDVTDADDKNYQMLLLTLAKFLVTKHYKLQIVDDWRKWKKEKPTENFFQSCVNPFAGDQELSEYFEKTCEKLFEMMEAIENPSETIPTMATPGDPDPEKPGEPEPASSPELSSSKMKMILTQSHTFINFFDISLNKAAYEVVFLLGSTYKSVVLLNCLNVFYYTEEKLRKQVEISDDSIDSEEKAHLYDLHRAFEYFVHHVEGTFALHRDSGDAILVGTHAEQFEEMSDLNARKDEIFRLITEYAQLINIDGALAFDGEIILSQELKKRYFELIDRDKRFEEYVPMKFIFFRCFLHYMDKLFITYKELKEYAAKFGVEVKRFLDLFRKLCSLFHLKTKEESPSFVVLQQTKFVKGLDRLYSSQASLQNVNEGLLSKEQARAIWSGVVNESISLYDFYTSILMTFGLMTQVTDCFFLPSLRLKYNTCKPSPESNSMIIKYNMALIPFHKLCLFVDVFTKEHSDIVLIFSPCADYNVAEFKCMKADQVIAKASIRFRCEYLELFITDFSSSHAELCCFLKTACVQVLNEMCSEFKVLKYTLSIVCPKSENDLHFAKFDPTIPSKQLTCEDSSCNCKFDTSTHPAGQWVLSAYSKHPKTAVHPRGT